MPEEKMIDLSHPDEIKVRRLAVGSRAECEEALAGLERQGFKVTVREHALSASDPEFYSAEIYAEKRTLLTEKEVAAKVLAKETEEITRRRSYRLLWLGICMGVFLVLLLLTFFLSPLVLSIKMLF